MFDVICMTMPPATPLLVCNAMLLVLQYVQEHKSQPTPGSDQLSLGFSDVKLELLLIKLNAIIDGALDAANFGCRLEGPLTEELHWRLLLDPVDRQVPLCQLLGVGSNGRYLCGQKFLPEGEQCVFRTPKFQFDVPTVVPLSQQVHGL